MKDHESKMMELSRQYLLANAKGTMDGALKAQTHRALCLEFISNHFSVDTESATLIQYEEKESLYSIIRKSTLELTDYLDEKIGFPLDFAPNYRKLTPLFYFEFIRLATESIQDNVFILTNQELKTVLDNCHAYTVCKVIESLESYGFKWLDCDLETRWVKMQSVIGDVVETTPNKFFGCSYSAVTFNGVQMTNKRETSDS